jgi:hypothetical protein
VTAAFGDFSSCQFVSRVNSDEYLIKETECSSKNDSIHRKWSASLVNSLLISMCQHNYVMP